MFDFKWSHAEKVIARQAFDLALRNELKATISEAKDRAAKISGLRTFGMSHLSDALNF